MIAQAGIELNLPNKKVQAVFDWDTGLMGFTEIVDDRATEFFFSDAPLEYRLALIEKMEGMFATKCLINWKICRKSDFSRRFFDAVKQSPQS